MAITPDNLFPDKGENDQPNNIDNLSAGLAERFIFYLNRVFATEKAKESVTEAGERLEDSISRLREVLNKKDAIKETEINFDREEKLVSNWQAQTKELDKSHLPDFKKPSARSWSGMKLKFLPLPNLNYILPVNNKLRVQGGLNTPLSLKIATLAIIAFIVSAFISIAQPQLAAGIAAASDAVFNYPLERIMALAGIERSEINTEFFKNLDKVLAENKKIKSDFIINNRYKLETAENSRNNFLITGNDLLGLPVKAESDNQNTENARHDWLESFDFVIWKIGQVVENSYDFINKSFGR